MKENMKKNNSIEASSTRQSSSAKVTQAAEQKADETNAVKEGQKSPSMDERTMIREQERLAKAAKRKKRKKLKIFAAVFIAVLVVAGVWYAGWGRSMLAANTASTTVKIEKSAGQSVVYARIDEINGNEITYTIAEEVKAEETTGTGGRPYGTDGAGVAGEQIEQPSQGGMQMPGGNMPDMSEMPGGGEMPDMSERQDMSQMPQGGRGQGGRGQNGEVPGKAQTSDSDSSTPDMSQMQSGFGRGEMPDMSQIQGGFGNRGGMTGGTVTGSSENSMIVYDGTTYRVGTETFTKYIPVGTDVTTKLGTVTTFSRLAAEDYVALIMDRDGDEEIIVAVYIIG